MAVDGVLEPPCSSHNLVIRNVTNSGDVYLPSLSHGYLYRAGEQLDTFGGHVWGTQLLKEARRAPAHYSHCRAEAGGFSPGVTGAVLKPSPSYAVVSARPQSQQNAGCRAGTSSIFVGSVRQSICANLSSISMLHV